MQVEKVSQEKDGEQQGKEMKLGRRHDEIEKYGEVEG
jgi:hypothetical protein